MHDDDFIVNSSEACETHELGADFLQSAKASAFPACDRIPGNRSKFLRGNNLRG